MIQRMQAAAGNRAVVTFLGQTSVQRMPFQLANPRIGSKTAGLATGNRKGLSFNDDTKHYIYQNASQLGILTSMAKSKYSSGDVVHYQCGLCGKEVEQLDSDLDHRISWEELVKKAFQQYSGDPSVYPVQERAQEQKIYNDLDNLMIVHSVCNNRKGGTMTTSQFKMSIEMWSDQGKFRPDKHLAIAVPPVAVSPLGVVSLASPGIGSKTAGPATGKRQGLSFNDNTKGYIYQNAAQLGIVTVMAKSKHSSGDVVYYQCGLCGKEVEQLDSDLDHRISWEELEKKAFQQYSGDPSVYPVQQRAQEQKIYNDLNNLMIVHSVCNNRKSGALSTSQFKMSIDMWSDQGKFRPDKHLS